MLIIRYKTASATVRYFLLRALAVVLVLGACTGEPAVEPDAGVDAATDAPPIEPRCTIAVAAPSSMPGFGTMCITTVTATLACDAQAYDRAVIAWARLADPAGAALAEVAYRCNEPLVAKFSTPCAVVITGAVSFQHPTLGGDPYAAEGNLHCEANSP